MTDENKKVEELKQIKKENRHRNGLWLVAALQITSLAICYYLGRSSKRKH